MTEEIDKYHLEHVVQDMSTVGIFAVDRRLNIVLWNRFMEIHSQLPKEAVLGKNLLECFPELNENWIARKIKSIMVLRNQSYTSWRQRPFLLKFPNVQAISSDSLFMYQDCSFWPLKSDGGQIIGACVSIHDVTEMAVTQQLLELATDEVIYVEEHSQRDALTGLYNRGFFDEQVTQDISRARRQQWDLSLMMIDIDHFKSINDTYGHPCGDEVLRRVAKIMLQQLRTSDMLCRYGGEEFSLILPQTGIEKSKFVGERIRRAVESAVITHDNSNITVTVSIGSATLQDNMTSGLLIAQADQAMYTSKKQGRNRITITECGSITQH